MLQGEGYGVGAKLVTSGSGEDMGHHHCSLTPPVPNKTWFHISLPLSPLPFSVAVVFIIRDIFPTPPAKTRSSYTPAARTHTPRRALSWSQEGPACPPTQAALRRPALPTSLTALPALGSSTVLSVTGEIDVNRDEKGNKTSFPPLPSSPARTTSSSPLNTPPPTQGFPFAESLNDLSWGQLELGAMRRLWEDGIEAEWTEEEPCGGVEFRLLKLGAGEGGGKSQIM